MIPHLSERALILAPLGRDATIAAAMLREAAIASAICTSLPCFLDELGAGAGFALVTEEALRHADLRALAAWIGDQDEWSDFPFVLLTERGGGIERNPAAERYLQTLGNVTFLERPFHPTTLVSLARAALRGRRRQYEARARLLALRESADNYRHALELNPQVAWTATPDGQLDTVAQRWFGWTGTSGLGETWAQAIHPDDLARSISAWSNAVRTGVPYDVEHRARMRDGAYHWMHSRAYPRRDDQGRIVKWYGTTEDIQERKAAEAALAESEARFRAITDSVEQMIWSTLPDGFHDYYNQRWYEYTGMPPGSTDGEAWSGMFHPEDQERAWARWRHSLSTGEPYHIEYRLRHRSGNYRWVLGRAQPVRDADGKIVRWYGTCTDIDDEVRARHVLARSREALEQEVAERTAERQAALAQLHEAQKLETLGQLTGGVAHDFNNLLTPITGALDLLQRRYGTDPRAARLLTGALQSAERAKTLVQRLLGFARRQALQTRALDVASLLDGIRELIKSSVGSMVEVRISAPANLPPALADANQLELAILNLCVNARDAMPDGGKLTIAAESVVVGPAYEPKLAPGIYIRLSVIDTGHGMDPETLSKAVEPFFSTKETGRGTGLGLSMVHGLAAQLGGSFTLSSAVAVGTRADLWLPVSSEVMSSRKAPADARAVATRPGLSILLVDDEDLVRAATAEMLRDLGHQTTEAAGGAEALARLGAGLAADIVITDYKMPYMDGEELARRVRESRPDMPVLVITGYIGSSDIVSHLPRLAKPYGQAELAAALGRALGDNVVQMPVQSETR
jgi:PAS domain S-box-containing protein